MNETKHGGGRPVKGTVVVTKSGRLQGIITLADGTRKRLPPFPKGTSRAMAEERTLARAQHAKASGATKPTPIGEVEAGSGAEWWTAYIAHREARGLSPVMHLYRPHIAPVIAGHPKDWTRADCERLVTVLDAKITSAGPDRISWKTAANVWSLFTRACKVASSAKASAGLRVRGDNPCAEVEGPERGEHRLMQWLYPSEFFALVACPEVPLRWRKLYALLAYTYIRPNELRVLEWADVNLDVGTIHITKAWDERRGRLKPPKTAAGVRHVPIEPPLVPLLRAMREADPDAARVVRAMPPMEDWAEKFRLHLGRAGITRAELFVTTATHKRIRLYDLRSTGITWRCLRKDYGPEIQQAAGHEKYDTTDGYIRTARVFVGRVGEPFPELPEALMFRSPNRSLEGQAHGIIATPPGIEPGLPA